MKADTQPRLSVVICTHNPRPHYLARVLDALKAQTLPAESWELLVIDNASATPLDGTLDLSWRPGARVIREEELGLTPARFRGIRESQAEVLVFIDDDNVLDARYLELADHIGATHPFLGAWGAGCIKPAFDHPPAEWVLPYARYLTLCDRTEVAWARIGHAGEHVPAGAGICVRRAVALKYLDVAEHSELRVLLGRRGSSLISGEDVDMALTSCDMGMGTGVFPELKMTHLIPDSRLDKAYLLRLVEDLSWSAGALAHLRGQFQPKKHGLLAYIAKRAYYTLRFRGLAREFFFAEWRGELRAQRDFGNTPGAASRR